MCVVKLVNTSNAEYGKLDLKAVSQFKLRKKIDKVQRVVYNIIELLIMSLIIT